jgi:DivIVA domain-containing protein
VPFLLLVLLLVVAGAVVIALIPDGADRRAGAVRPPLGPDAHDRAPGALAGLPAADEPLEPDDLLAVRFALAPRGYRCGEVEAVLDRAAEELAARDTRIAELEARLAAPVPDEGPADPTAIQDEER